jgi:hypothetical protein
MDSNGNFLTVETFFIFIMCQILIFFLIIGQNVFGDGIKKLLKRIFKYMLPIFIILFISLLLFESYPKQKNSTFQTHQVLCERWVSIDGINSRIGVEIASKDCNQIISDNDRGFCQCKTSYRYYLERGRKIFSCEQICEKLENQKRKIPKNIIQIYRSHHLPPRVNDWSDTWKKLNPHYKYYLFDDNQMENFVEKNFEEKIVKAYKRLNIPVCKSDFFRILSMYKLGGIVIFMFIFCFFVFKFIFYFFNFQFFLKKGIYADIDTECIQPIDKWIADEKVIVAPEVLIGKEKEILLESQEKQVIHYCNWVFASEKENIVFKTAIDLIVERIFYNETELEKYSRNIVHFLTGPALFTDAVRANIDEVSLLYPFQFGGMRTDYVEYFGSKNLELSSYLIHHYGSQKTLTETGMKGYPSWIKDVRVKKVFVDSEFKAKCD